MKRILLVAILSWFCASLSMAQERTTEISKEDEFRRDIEQSALNACEGTAVKRLGECIKAVKAYNNR